MLTRLRALGRNLWRRAEVDRELSDELAAYVDLIAAEKERAGLSPGAARRAALLEAGGVEQVKEEVRAVRSGAWLEVVRRDLRFGARALLRVTLLSAIVVATLAISIGANTAVFSVAHAL